ncbi:hypothetical protein [Aquimarina sp. RZ0]|uniref:hypothetical protein n=1 Tax=Aquimarina sp. RZ0 TaxID=2607730 RepID=UPI0011F3B838|nr:hypothetical protein [Aquimarina sp. RZ0]KAA1242497.1 hypothetical protein F0000_25325 [Aquimarina sp. RZ0]
MIKKIFFFLLLFVSIKCKNNVSDELTPYILNDTQVIIKIHSLKQAKSFLSLLPVLGDDAKIKSTNFIEKLYNAGFKDSIQGLLYVTGSEKKQKNFSFLYRGDENILKTLKKRDFTEINEQLICQGLYFKKIKQTFLISSSESVIHGNHENIKEDFKLKKVIYSLEKSSILSVVIRASTLAQTVEFSSVYNDTNQSNSDWVFLSAVVDKNFIQLKGSVSNPVFSLYKPEIFKNTTVSENKVAKVIPADVDTMISYTFGNYSLFKENLAREQGKKIVDISHELDFILNHTNQITTITMGEHNALVLSQEGQYHVQKKMKLKKSLVFQGIPIYQFGTPGSFIKILAPLIKDFQGNFFCFYNDFIIFSKHKNALKRIINSNNKNQVLTHQTWYNDIQKQLSKETSVFMMNIDKKNKKKVTTTLHKDLVKSSEIVPAFGQVSLFQVSKKKENQTHQLKLVFYKKEPQQTASCLVNSIIFDHKIIASSFASNPDKSAKNMWAAIQDSENIIYLLSGNGEILWKKQLDGPILGKFKFIDHPDHIGYQLLFNTTSFVYLLDELGNDVSNFPVSFEQSITQPLALFDYDHNKRYRILITQKNTITTLDTHARRVTGLKFAHIEHPLIAPPIHVKLDSTDYILLLQNKGKLSITDRIGKSRVTIKKPINFSSNPWYSYSHNFISTTEDNKIIQIDKNGDIVLNDINLQKGHLLKVTKDYNLVFYSNGNLIIDNEKINLAVNTLENVKVMELDQTFFLTGSDKDRQNIYLFDQSGIWCQGFPIAGNTILNIRYSKTEGQVLLTVQKNTNSIEILQMAI